MTKPAVPQALCIKTVNVLGVRIHTISVSELLDTITGTALNGKKALIAYVNIHALNLAYQQAWFRDFLNGAEVVFCDGFGVKWGARLLGWNIPDRYTPPDWIPLLAQACIRHDLSLFFLGARPGVADEAAAYLREEFPSLRIVGTHHGYFDKSPHSRQNRTLIQQINAAKPNVLVLGFGMPLQERWLMENWAHVDANVALTGGAVFDYLSGKVRRAPRWMTENGLEWLGRLIIEPWRLWRRYLVGNPLFLYRVLKQRFGRLGFD